MRILKLTKEEAESIIYKDHSDYDIIETTISDTSRWSIHYNAIVHNRLTDKYYRIHYSQGATECQDQEPFYTDIVEATEVEKKLITLEQWVIKE